MVPGDYPNLKAASEVLVDQLKRIGMVLDVVTTDWATMTTRAIKRDTPSEGGFHLHMLNAPAGVTYQPAAWRADLEGVLEGVPKFWNVRRV